MEAEFPLTDIVHILISVYVLQKVHFPQVFTSLSRDFYCVKYLQKVTNWRICVGRTLYLAGFSCEFVSTSVEMEVSGFKFDGLVANVCDERCGHECHVRWKVWSRMSCVIKGVVTNVMCDERCGHIDLVWNCECMRAVTGKKNYVDGIPDGPWVQNRDQSHLVD